MKKKYDLEDLDCAVCASKMEKGIRKIEGVQDAGVNFLTQKMFIEAEEDQFPRILEEAVKVIKKVDSGCKVLL